MTFRERLRELQMHAIVIRGEYEDLTREIDGVVSKGEVNFVKQKLRNKTFERLNNLKKVNARIVQFVREHDLSWEDDYPNDYVVGAGVEQEAAE
jgi:hypothetical protein